MRRSLLASVQGLIERTYATDTGIDNAARFVVGDRGFRRIVRRHPVVDVVEDAWADDAAGVDRDRHPHPQVLVRHVDGRAAVAIYFPDALIERLEHCPPTRRLDAGNVDDFAVFVEEIDHFVQIVHGWQRHREMSLLELEIRANISKALVLQHFIVKLNRGQELTPEERHWVRFHLFDKHRYVDEDRRVRQRYQEARRFAVALLERLGQLPAAVRLERLRRWNALPAARKLRLGAAALN